MMTQLTLAFKEMFLVGLIKFGRKEINVNQHLHSIAIYSCMRSFMRLIFFSLQPSEAGRTV